MSYVRIAPIIYIYPNVSLFISLYVRGMKKKSLLSVCSLGVSCNEMIDTPMLLSIGRNRNDNFQRNF